MLKQLSYRLRDGDPWDERTANSRFLDIDLRLHTLEEAKISWEQAVADLLNVGLERINSALSPLYVEFNSRLEAITSDLENLENVDLVNFRELVKSTLDKAKADFDSLLTKTKSDAEKILGNLGNAVTEEQMNQAIEAFFNSLFPVVPAVSASYGYDTEGRVSTVTEAIDSDRDRLTTYTYENGRVSKAEIDFDGKRRTESYIYDAEGRISGMTSVTGDTPS